MRILGACPSPVSTKWRMSAGAGRARGRRWRTRSRLGSAAGRSGLRKTGTELVSACLLRDGDVRPGVFGSRLFSFARSAGALTE